MYSPGDHQGSPLHEGDHQGSPLHAAECGEAAIDRYNDSRDER